MVFALAMTACALLVTDAHGYAAMPIGVSGKAEFAGALSRLSHVNRLEVVGSLERIAHLKPGSQSSRLTYDLHFIAPDRVRVQEATIEQVQVGHRECTRLIAAVSARNWVCGIAPPPRISQSVQATLIPAELINTATYDASLGSEGRGRARHSVTVIAVRGRLAAPRVKLVASFAGTLVVNRRTGLPESFRSSEAGHGLTYARWQLTFRYGGRFSITLPHVRGAPLPPPPQKP